VLNNSQIDIFAGASTAVPVVQIAALQNDNLAPQSVRITQNPQHGSARPDPETGSIEYSADPNYAGADGLRYEICYTSEPDICGQATLAIAVRQFRITAADDQSSTPGSTGVLIPVLANDTDRDGTLDPASITTSDGPANGSVNLNTATGEITYTPEAGFFDVDSFRYRVCDRAYPAMCATAQVSVQVTRREPVANDDTDIVVIRGRAQILDVLANDLDPDQVLSPGQIDIVSGPGRGSRLTPNRRGLQYQTSLSNSDSFRYRACSTTIAGLCSNVASVVIRIVEPVVANDDTITIRDPEGSTVKGESGQINVLDNDKKPAGQFDMASLKITKQPVNGRLTIDRTNGVVTYTVLTARAEPDSFVYEVCHPSHPLNCARATVRIEYVFVVG
jgi:hypothetical protein